MAFTQLTNSAGLLHHGGQMAWTSVSDTRVAMLTVTGDFKVIVQEVNFANGATTLGPASFVKQLTNSPVATNHIRMKIRSMPNGRLAIMVPNNWLKSGVITYRPTGLLQTRSNYTNVGFPSAYDVIIMERDANGYYALKSSVLLDFSQKVIWSGSNYTNYYVFPGGMFQITEASDSQIVISRPPMVTTASGFGIGAAIDGLQTFTIPHTAGVAGTPVESKVRGNVSRTQQNIPVDMRYRRMPDKTPVLTYTCAATTNTLGTGPMIVTLKVLKWNTNDPYTSEVPAGGDTYNVYGNAKSILPMAADYSKYVQVGGYTDSVPNMAINNLLSDPGQEFLHPLDTAWVTNTCAVVLGVPSNVVSIDTQYAEANGYGPVLDCDAAVSIASGLNGVLCPLYMSFREIAGGAYCGPYDPINTGYFFYNAMNVDNIVHRIDDSHFWMIGCFMENANATPKLGIITVGIPA